MVCRLEDYQEEKERRIRRLTAYNQAIKKSTLHMSSVIVEELVSERKKKQMTQQDIADITGVQAPNITRFESAKTVPTLVMLQKYASALGKHVELRLVDD